MNSQLPLAPPEPNLGHTIIALSVLNSFFEHSCQETSAVYLESFVNPIFRGRFLSICLTIVDGTHSDLMAPLATF